MLLEIKPSSRSCWLGAVVQCIAVCFFVVSESSVFYALIRPEQDYRIDTLLVASPSILLALGMGKHKGYNGKIILRTRQAACPSLHTNICVSVSLRS